MSTTYLLAALWLGTSTLTALGTGRGIAMADTAGRLAPVIPLFPSAAGSGEEDRRRGPALPPHLSPRAGGRFRRLARRVARSQAMADLRAHGWLAGLLLAGVAAPIVLGGLR